MASEPLSHTPPCKHEADMGALLVGQVLSSQKPVSRGWSSEAGLPTGSRPGHALVGSGPCEQNPFPWGVFFLSVSLVCGKQGWPVTPAQEITSEQGLLRFPS